MRLSRWFGYAHKWIALVVGIQVLLWITGGVVMSWFPIEHVRGEHNARVEPPRKIAGDLAPIERILKAGGGAPLRAEYRYMGDRLVVELATPGAPMLVDAATAEVITPLTEDVARAIATRDFIGPGKPREAVLQDARSTEYRGAVPVWRITFDDAEDTSIYVSPHTGKVVARRNATWRFYDFFWMLHIMDYAEREDFNHPLLQIAAIIALCVALTGLALIPIRFGWIRRLRHLRHRWQRG